MSLPDRLIGGRYRIVRKIAEGGMGEVYEAQHNLSKKSVALKILFPHIGKDEAARQRFLREVSAPAQIGHDGIVEVYDAGFDTEDGSLFVAMEFLDGEPLRDRLAKGGVSLDLLLDYFEYILDPLAAAHEKGIVHRDLKPENVFVAKKRDGTEIIKLLDFGIARDLDSSNNNVTHTGIAMGTPHYMAPEQAMSAKGVTAAADVWALGVMLYEALTGRPPFDGETPSAIVVHACTQAHVPIAQVAPHVPPPLAMFVDRCLQKNAADRPANAGQMLAELQAVRRQIGSVTGVAAAAAGMASFRTGVPTPSPIQPPAAGPTGTAYLPQVSGGAYGTPPPTGGYGTAPAGGFATPAPGGFGAAPSGFGTPAPGGFGTPAPSGFGTPPPSGFGTSGGFGSPTYAAPKKSGGGLAIGIIAFVVIGGLVLLGGGIGLAFWLTSDDDAGEDATANVRIETNITAGELMIDGRSRGPIVPNQQVRVDVGAHNLELREGGQVVASASITVTAGHDQTVALNRAPTPNDPNTVPQNDPNTMVPGNVQTFTGSLRRGDSTLQSGEYFDEYTFQWAAGTQVQLDIHSSDFDSYIILKAPSGAQQDNDDRVPGNLDAGLTVTLNETGQWRVLCTSFAAHTTGDYTLTVRGP